MSKLNVKTGDCALCSNKDVDTIQADCHLLYRGEWINQISPVCFDCAAQRVVKKEVKAKEEVKLKPKPEVKYPEKKMESKPESVFYAGKHSKK